MSHTTIISAIKGIFIALAVISVCLLVYSFVLTREELASKRVELSVVSSKLENQNKIIESMKLDIEAYKNKKPKIVEKIVTKYEKIQVKDKTCEAYLEAIYKAQVEFFNRKNTKGQTE